MVAFGPAHWSNRDRAHAAGFTPLKINAVLMRETLDDAPALLEWALAHDARLRFIEQMPLDADEAWQRANMIPAA